MQNVGIVGLGLIGGSLAKTIKLHTPYTVYGTDKNADTMRRAFLMEAIDGELTAETLPQCDVVLICLYPQGIIDYVTAHAADFKPDSLVIDCGGVKQVICDALFPVSQRYAWHFIGGHPMAGREYSGFKYARDDLFDHASMILCGHGDDVSISKANICTSNIPTTLSKMYTLSTPSSTTICRYGKYSTKCLSCCATT